MSDINWWLMLLSFLLGALITWFWSVRRATREVPRTVVDRDRDFTGSVGGTVAGVGAGVAGAAAGAAALGNHDEDIDVDSDFDATTRRGDLDVDRPATEVYDRTTDESVDASWDAPDVDAPSVDAPAVDTSWDAPEVDAPSVDAPSFDAPSVDAPSFDAPDVDAPDVDAPDLDAPTIQRSSLDLPDVDAPDLAAPDLDVPDVESPGVAGGAAGAAVAGAAGLGAASWASRSGDGDSQLDADVASEPAHFAGGSGDVAGSSDAEIIESESDLETPAAPTGEADWSDTSGPSTSVLGMRDAGDLAAAKEPVVTSESTPTESFGAESDSTDTASSFGSDSATDAPASTEALPSSVTDTSSEIDPSSEADTSSDTSDSDTSNTSGVSAAGAAGLAGAGAAVAAGKFGRGSAEPGADGSGPSGWAIKGNEDSRLFHTEDSPSYKRTRAEVWFEDEDTARKAGFTKWNEKNRSGGGAAKLVAIPEGKFGKGSADPGEDGSGPEGWTIKGNEDSNLFHTQESPYFGRTKAEIWFESEEAARGAGFVRWDEKDRSGSGSGGAAKLVDIPEGRFGKGSTDPAADGSGPEGWAIKGNENSMLFHTEDSPAYGRTKAEVWFQDEETARKAGFTKWNERNR